MEERIPIVAGISTGRLSLQTSYSGSLRLFFNQREPGCYYLFRESCRGWHAEKGRCRRPDGGGSQVWVLDYEWMKEYPPQRKRPEHVQHQKTSTIRHLPDQCHRELRQHI